MNESKRTDKKTIFGVVAFAIVAIAVIIATFKGIFDFAMAALVFAVVGVIFYFLFVGINYKHSIYGGRFEEHFGGEDKGEKQ